MAHGQVNTKWFVGTLDDCKVSVSKEDFTRHVEHYPTAPITVHRFGSPTGDREYTEIHLWTEDNANWLNIGYRLTREGGRTLLKDETKEEMPDY